MKMLMLLDTEEDHVCINPTAVKFMKISDVNRNDTVIYFVDGSHMHVKMALPDTMDEINKALG